ncbi:hypothetical protein bpuCAU1_001230 (plasmid) [Borrelia puertoricensis]|uniref:hypothetical protein n=1 Tax=Borrelia puertoricensis TaxID=2756107 RepID=UPI001FF5B6F3|nr:hypothetical protein [Borrelia puertoricensis]UPA18964.1 hypothetical protein bpuSUM_001502 [Borrelia puertoricensis]
MKKISIIFYSLCCLGVMSCEQGKISLDQGSIKEGLDNLVKTYLNLDKTGKTEEGAESLQGGVPGGSGVENSLVVPVEVSGDDQREDLAKAPEEVQGNAPENDLEEVYTKLERSVTSYRSQLNNARGQFNPNHHSLQVPFNEVNARFAALDQQADIYAALAHDVETVRDLERVLNRLNLQKGLPLSQENSTISENKLADNLLMLIWQVGCFTRKIIDIHLSNGNLNKIKASKNVEKLAKITAFLEDFIKVRSDAVKTIQDQIKLLVSKNDKSDLLDAIKNTVGLSDNAGKEIQKVSYLIVELEGNIQLLIN